MPDSQLTELLAGWSGGDSAALERLVPLVYDELRLIAHGYLARERKDHTLAPTALVHEAYLRLVGQRVAWQNRAHFFGIAASLMRRILVDYARQKQADKRGGGVPTVALDSSVDWPDERNLDLENVDHALNRLEKLDPLQSRIVELRFFCGLTIEEAAEALGTSPSTVKREWKLARAWLLREIDRR